MVTFFTGTWVIFLGLLDDAFSVLAFGSNTFALTLLGMGGARTRDLFVGDSLFFLTSYLVLGKWVRDLLHWVAVGEGLREPFVDTMLIQSPISAVYAGVIGLLVIAISGLGMITIASAVSAMKPVPTTIAVQPARLTPSGSRAP